MLPGTWRSAPSFRIAPASAGIHRATGRQDSFCVPGVTLCGRDEADAAVKVLVVVPGRETTDPGARLFDACKRTTRVIRSVLQRTEERLRVGIVVAHSRAAVRGNHAETLHRRLQRGAFHRAAVVLMDHEPSPIDSLRV